MRLPKRGERGFTLIELLIVVAILGVLAAVVIPNVTRFVGAGKQEAAETELHNIQLAVTSMMLENGITLIPNPRDTTNSALDLLLYQTNDMGAFPDPTSDFIGQANEGKTNDPDGLEYGGTDKKGYLLYGHDMIAELSDNATVNYVVVQTTTYYYTCQPDGTVNQWAINGAALVWD